MSEEYNNQVYEYFKKYLKLTKENINPLYKYTKYLTEEKLKATGITEEEIKLLQPSGYQLNLKNSNLAIIDIDLKKDSTFYDELPTEKYNITIPDKICYKRISITNSISRYESEQLFLRYFTTLFDTFFVKTPNDGFHFYFINDLQPEQIAEIFGCIRSSYMKCNTDQIDVDVFLSDGCHDTYLVLPFSKIVSEKNSSQDSSTFLSYSPLSFTNNKGLLSLSKIIDILKKFINKVEYNDVLDNNTYNEENYVNRNDYSRRAFAINDDLSRVNLLDNIKLMYNFINDKMNSQIKGWTSPITTFNLITTIAFLPNDIIPEVFELFLNIFKDKLSESSWKEIPEMLKRCLDPSKTFKLWSPSYLNKVINGKFNKNLELKKVWFVYDTDESKAKAYGRNFREIIDNPIIDLKEIIDSMKIKFPKLGSLKD